MIQLSRISRPLSRPSPARLSKRALDKMSDQGSVHGFAKGCDKGFDEGFPMPFRSAGLFFRLFCLCATFPLQAQFVPGQGFGFGAAGAGANRQTRTSRTYAPNGEVGQAVVSVAPDSRSLIVIADEPTRQYISQVVSNLDRPRPQVLIKVVFLEVTRNDASDIGIEGTFGHQAGGAFVNGLITNVSLINPGSAAAAIVPSSIDPTYGHTILSGANLFGAGGAAGSALPTAAGLYSIAGQDYTVIIHAIASSGKAKVLSRPSIVARNNQPATILVGQTVPLITSVRYDTLGNAINGITYTDVGIILRVTPFITTDGMVELILSPEISSVSKTDSTPLASGAGGTNSVNAPFIDKRSADTVVVTPDGKTVIIGGMIQRSKAESENKIPFLGDLPWIGNLFKRKFKSDVNTELVIFLTPHIIPAPGQLVALSATEQSRSEAAKSLSDQELDRFLDTLPTKDTKQPPSKSKSKSNPNPNPGASSFQFSVFSIRMRATDQSYGVTGTDVTLDLRNSSSSGT